MGPEAEGGLSLGTVGGPLSRERANLGPYAFFLKASRAKALCSFPMRLSDCTSETLRKPMRYCASSAIADWGSMRSFSRMTSPNLLSISLSHLAGAFSLPDRLALQGPFSGVDCQAATSLSTVSTDPNSSPIVGNSPQSAVAAHDILDRLYDFWPM
jgi:hypothetical protein